MTDDFYHAFENRYRGSRELIKSRLRIYLPFLEPLKALYEDCTVVDLGCGRGEWLELMGEVGISARGVDLDDGMLAACYERGLSVERGDAIECLGKLPDASVVVVSGFHVAEHIPFEALQQLVQQALRVLKPGGLLILETPNPENLSVGACKFYYDPTHQRPIPPLLLSFLSEHYGFARTKVIRLQERPGLAEAPEVGLTDVLSGASPDYAVVAQKGGMSAESLAHFDAVVEKDWGVDLDTLAMRYDANVGSKLSEILARVDRSEEVEAQARANLAARDEEIERLKAQSRADLAARDEEIERLKAHVKTLHGGCGEAERKAALAQAELRAVYASTSWRLTAPLRAISIGAGRIRALPARGKLAVKVRLKPGLVGVGAYLEDRPALKAKVFRAMQALPRLRARLARAARPLDMVADAPSQNDDTCIPPVDDLTASARRVYQDLLDARAAAVERADRK